MKTAFLPGLIVLLLLWMGGEGTALAQPQAESPPVALAFAIWDDGYNLQDLLDENPDLLGVPVYMVSSQGVVSASALLGKYGQPVDYRGGAQVVLYAQPPAPDQPLPPALCRFSLKPGIRSAQVMLFPLDQNGPEKYRAIVFGNEANGFGPGMVRLQSLYKVPLYVRIGGKVLTLAPYQSEVIGFDQSQTRGVTLQVVVRDEDTQKARPLIQRFLRTNPNNGIEVFLLPDPKRRGAAKLKILNAP